jgi:hypothetical protein
MEARPVDSVKPDSLTPDGGGAWSYLAKPTIRTACQANSEERDELDAHDRRHAARHLPRVHAQPVLERKGMSFSMFDRCQPSGSERGAPSMRGFGS